MGSVTVAVILATLVGLAIVVQNGVNAELMKDANLWLLLAVGNMIAATGSLLVFLFNRTRGPIVEELGRLPLAVIVTGVCGIVITAGMPNAISRIGVFTAVMIVIGCQIITGLAWDKFYANQPISGVQLAGAALVVVGVILVMRPNGS